MKTRNQFRNNRISILFSLTAILLFPFISNAQLNLNSSGNVGIGTATQTALLELKKSNLYLVLNSTNATATDAKIYIQRNGVCKWVFGPQVGNGTEDFNLYNYNTATINLSVNQATGNVGIGTATPGAYKLHVNGTSQFNGNMIIYGNCTRTGTDNFTSDQKFKTNIDTIKNALGIIKQLNPKTFNFDTANVYGLDFSNKRQYGLIAQQVATVLPELVTDVEKPADLDTAGNVVHQAITYKALNYNAFIAILMKGIQEQQKTISGLTSKTTKQDSINAALQDQLNNLANTINACCNADNKGEGNSKSLSDGLSQTNVELNNSQTIVLEQNIPNPYAERTTINYFLPDNTGKAQMLFYDARGILIQSVDLIQKGKGALNVFAQDLTNGIYTYTLVVDGRIIETKKMVKQ